MIEDRKIMATIVWNPQGFYLIDALPKGQKFNASSDIDIIVQSFLENRPTGPGPGLIIHAENARPHTARKNLKLRQENRLGMIPHPLHSQNLMPSDFFLFEHVKHATEWAEFPSEKTLLATINQSINQSINKSINQSINQSIVSQSRH
jgi:hypothetical protein